METTTLKETLKYSFLKIEKPKKKALLPKKWAWSAMNWEETTT